MGIIMLNNKVLMNQNKIAMYVPPFEPPAKGSIVKINLDGTDRVYRVLSVDGNVCKVMGMFDNFRSEYNETSTTTTMGTLTVQKYEGSTLDTKLDTAWYNILNSTAKAAIVPESVICDAWSIDDTGDPVYSGTYGASVPGGSSYTISKYAGGTLNIGNRNVFILGIQDVIDYLSDESMRVDTSVILCNVNIWKMFWNDEVSHQDSILWLQSSFTGDSKYARAVAGEYGIITGFTATNSAIVRPALNLDMSKIPYELIS